MPALRELQGSVMRALRAPREGGASAAVLPWLRSTPRLAAARRLAVYRNNFRESLIAALGAVYPVVARLVGEGFFRRLCIAYLADYPPHAACVQAFGGAMANFLGDFAPAAELPYLADVALLEWALHEAYHEQELAPLAAQRLSAVSPLRQGELCLRLQPSARFVASRYPVLAIWQANQADAAEEDRAISLDDGGVKLLVVQRALEVEMRKLDAAEDDFLRALAAGAALAAATQSALAFEAGFDLGAALARHLSLGLFTGFALPQDEEEAKA